MARLSKPPPLSQANVARCVTRQGVRLDQAKNNFGPDRGLSLVHALPHYLTLNQSKFFGISERQIQTYIANLKMNGFITVTIQNRYERIMRAAGNPILSCRKGVVNPTCEF